MSLFTENSKPGPPPPQLLVPQNVYAMYWQEVVRISVQSVCGQTVEGVTGSEREEARLHDVTQLCHVFGHPRHVVRVRAVLPHALQDKKKNTWASRRGTTWSISWGGSWRKRCVCQSSILRKLSFKLSSYCTKKPFKCISCIFIPWKIQSGINTGQTQ